MVVVMMITMMMMMMTMMMMRAFRCGLSLYMIFFFSYCFYNKVIL